MVKANYIQDFSKWEKGFTYAAPLTVRFSDIDMFGIANNATIISYLEFARIEYFKHLGLMQDWLLEEQVAVPVVADIQCDYVKPIYYDETISIGVKVETIGQSSIDIHYLGKNNKDQIVFTGRSTIVQVHKETGKGHPWTHEEKQYFETTEVAKQ
ncbi:MAG TPA: acyl-CoA thioesterase [Sporosarcina sp.]|nr:acyl-CoA thioesterase [Sporosarcina sp.]